MLKSTAMKSLGILLILMTLCTQIVFANNENESNALESLREKISEQALEGAGSSGGGQSVITASGFQGLLDFINPKQLIKINKMSTVKHVEEVYLAEKRYVTRLAFEDTDFFTCGKVVLKDHSGEFPVFDTLLEQIDNLIIYQVEFPLFNDTATKFEDVFNLPIIARPSETIDRKYQYPAASYAKGRLWISKRIYQRFSEEERCGLQVHEALRHLNYQGILDLPVTTPEIEIMTRYLLKKSFTIDGKKLDFIKNKLNLYGFYENYFEKANELFDMHDKLSLRIQDPNTLPREKVKLYDQSKIIFQTAYEYQRLGMKRLTKQSQPAIDSIKNSFFVDDEALTKRGMWDIRSFLKY